MINLTTISPTLFDNAEMSARVQSNMRQMSRISYKRKEALELAEAIKEFFEDNDIPLSQFRKPKKKKDEKLKGYIENKHYNESEAVAFEKEKERYDALGIDTKGMKLIERRSKESDPLEAHTMYPDFVELSKAYFNLVTGNKSIVARFKSGDKVGVQLMAHWYSRHKICPVWNMRKSQIIRKKYREFLENYSVAADENGIQELLIKSHIPVHMVLTLPHSGGEFQGQRFYARKLLQYFHEMRRCKFFKDGIFGGEYGLEIKKSATNGLHIHLHSFCFLKRDGDNKTCVNAFRDLLSKKWEQLTGAKFCHFETLYYYKRDPDNAKSWIMEHSRKRNKDGVYDYEYENNIEIVQDSTGEWVRRFPKFVRKKHYITAESTIEEYTSGVMECIKYHFKMDDYKDGAGEWDVPLIMDILNNSVNLRFYSRYGGFLKIPDLNFNTTAKEDPTDEEICDQMDEDNEGENVIASSDGVESSLVNPFTYELAKNDEYDICVVRPEKLIFRKDLRGRDSLYYHDPDDFIEVHKGFELKEIIKAVCTNNLHQISSDPYFYKQFSKN
jgi:hypothetical protein